MSKTLLDSMPQIVWITDNKGRITYLNQFWMDYTGLPFEKAQSWIDLLHPEEQQRSVEIWEHSINTGTPYEHEVRMKKADGSYGWIFSRGNAIRNEKGEITEWLGFGIDITEKKAIELKLIEAKQQLLQERMLLEAVLQQLPVAVFVADPSGNLILRNKKLKELTGGSANYKQIEDYTNFGVFKEDGTKCPEDELPIFKCLRKRESTFNEFFIVKTPLRQEVLLRITTMVNIILLYFKPVINSHGNLLAGVSVSEDVTNTRKMEREALELQSRERVAIESSKMKSQFLANMSHEIRTPLNGILGMAQILAQDKTLNQEQMQYVEVMKNSGQLLLSIINDILDFSKIEAGKLEIENIPFSFDEAFKLVIDLMTPVSLEKKIPIITDLPTFPKVLGDPSRFQQILCNLLSNALKFTKQGQVNINATSELKDNKCSLTIKLKDTGIGIDKEMMSRLFEPFTQKDSSTSRQYGGSGLGLSISKRLIELMKGSISVESTVNVGTEFTCCFHFTLANTSEKEKISLACNLPSLRILLAEDNKINQIITLKLLQTHGFKNIQIVNTGKEAVSAVHSGSFDLILMDLHMPEMDGLEATKQIRKFNKNILIVAVSASCTQQDKSECLTAGMDGHVCKPISVDLGGYICDVLRRRGFT